MTLRHTFIKIDNDNWNSEEFFFSSMLAAPWSK
jgi:hypothetical protein